MLPLLVAAAIVMPMKQTPTKPQVMILGTYHFANPKADLIKTELDDHMSPKRQNEIAEVVALLAKYKPTKIMVERPPEDGANDRYHSYLEGNYTLAINEIDQIGMRLAKQMGNKDIFPIDYRSDMDFDPVFAFAKEKNDQAFFSYFESAKADVEKMLNGLPMHTVRENYLTMNSPESLHQAMEFYVRLLRLNDGKNYPGADLLAGWYSRNLRIYGNMAKVVEPGDRVLVIFGQGHAPILRQLVVDGGDMELVEPNQFLKS